MPPGGVGALLLLVAHLPGGCSRNRQTSPTRGASSTDCARDLVVGHASATSAGAMGAAGESARRAILGAGLPPIRRFWAQIPHL